MSALPRDRTSDVAYEHTQASLMVLVPLGIGAALVLGLVFAIARSVGFVVLLIPTLLLAVLLFVAIAFRSLTIRVRGERLEWSFGSGLFRRSVPLARILDAEVVRNRLVYGWGIRRTPHGWLYNVSGLNAVEVTLENGTRFRLGTDDPQGLAHAIRTARAQRG